jgi:pimeloyl-ACP methyl ester carboxylesterase
MKKNQSIKIVFAIAITVNLVACSRLDDNLFNPNTQKITAYTFDNYTGEVDFRLDASYKIPDSLIHLITLASKMEDEGSPTKIYGVYIGNINTIATDTVIMYCHGNKDHMDFYWPRAALLANTGGKNRFGVFMIDYRGYGLSEGKPSENGLYADVDAALQWLKINGLSDNRLVMYGFSMGTAPATKLTAEPRSMRPVKLMLEAPFASSEVMVQDATGLALPATFVTDLKINNAEEIKTVQQPFFWIHGIDDHYLNITTNGELVYNNHKGIYKEPHRVPGAGHSNVPNTIGFENYLQAIEDFILR